MLEHGAGGDLAQALAVSWYLSTTAFSAAVSMAWLDWVA
jgi:hypothetical protein